jgi:hypothetical protein
MPTGAALREEAMRLGYFWVCNDREFRMIRSEGSVALRVVLDDRH